MTKRLLLIILAISAVTVSVAAYYRNGADGDAPRFTTAAATRGDIVDTVEATGALEAVTTVQVSTQVSGTIKALYADYNSQVRKGQVVAQLEPSLFQTQVEQASATLQRQQAEVESARVQVADTKVKLKRAEDLWAKQLLPATDLDTARAAAMQAEASLKASQAQVTQGRASLRSNEVNLGHATIKAPIDGIVISRSVDVGQTVAASMSAPTLFVIAQDLKEMQVNASVDESDIGRIQAGQKVNFRVDAYPDETFIGTVKQVRLEPVVEQNVVSYVTVIDVPNPDLKLKPGMTANVTIEIARADDVLRVPNAALRFRPTAETFTALGQQAPEPRAAGSQPARGARTSASPRTAVWVFAEGRLRRVPVEAGITDGTATAILGGEIAEGALVATGVPAQSAAPAASGAASPLLPQRGNRGGRRGVR